jgi:hypothetical protein
MTQKIRIAQFAVVQLLLVWLLSSVSWAGTGSVIEKKCPVCSEKLSVTVLFSSNNAGGADPDLMERAGGAFPLIVEPILCSNCLFAAWSESSLDEPVSDELKQALLSEDPPFVVPEHEPIVPNGPLRGSFTEGLDSEQVTPAWVRYDLLGQQLAFLEGSAWLQFQAAQRGAWAVRLRENPFIEFLFDMSREEFEEALKGLKQDKQRDNPATAQIEAARQLLTKNELSKNEAVVAGYLLRTHGELTELEKALPRLITAIGEDDLTSKVEASIALERRYLIEALKHTEVLLANPPEGVDRGILHYLEGEFHRRLDQPEQARIAYERALEQKLPEWLRD